MDEKKLLIKLKCEKEAYKRWKQSQVTWKECGDTVQIRNGVRKTRTYPDLNMVRDMKDNKEGLYRYISNNKKN